MFPRFYLHRFILRWSHFILSILLPLLQMRMKGFTLSCMSFEDLCGPLQPLEVISPVVGMFQCWLLWACLIKAHNFSRGERRYFAGLWDAWSFFISQRSAHSTRSIAFSQALFRGVPLEDICVAARCPLCTLLSASITWILTRLRVPRFYLLEPAMHAVWFIIGPDRAAFLACSVWYIVPKAF